MVVSDCLPSAHLDESKPEIPENKLNQHVHSLISNFPMTDDKLEEFKIETGNDSAFQIVKKYVCLKSLQLLILLLNPILHIAVRSYMPKVFC